MLGKLLNKDDEIEYDMFTLKILDIDFYYNIIEDGENVILYINYKFPSLLLEKIRGIIDYHMIIVNENDKIAYYYKKFNNDKIIKAYNNLKKLPLEIEILLNCKGCKIKLYNNDAISLFKKYLLKHDEVEHYQYHIEYNQLYRYYLRHVYIDAFDEIANFTCKHEDMELTFNTFLNIFNNTFIFFKNHNNVVLMFYYDKEIGICYKLIDLSNQQNYNFLMSHYVRKITILIYNNKLVFKFENLFNFMIKNFKYLNYFDDYFNISFDNYVYSLCNDNIKKLLFSSYLKVYDELIKYAKSIEYRNVLDWFINIMKNKENKILNIIGKSESNDLIMYYLNKIDEYHGIKRMNEYDETEKYYYVIYDFTKIPKHANNKIFINKIIYSDEEIEINDCEIIHYHVGKIKYGNDVFEFTFK